MKKLFQLEGLFSVIIGLLLLLIPTYVIISVLQFILGAILIVFYLPITILHFHLNNNDYLKIKSLIFTILGFVIMVFGFNVIGSVVGAILLVFLIIDLVKSNNKKETLKKDLIKYIIAAVLIVVGVNKVIDVVVIASGILLLIFGIIKLVAENIPKKENKKTSNNNNTKINEKVIDVEFEKHED